MPKRTSNLIFDLGAHVGQDTDYYLKRGFDVVAVEANPALAAGLRSRFAGQIATGKLRVVEAAIAEHPGTGIFYRFEKDVYGTISADWKDRNLAMGEAPQEISVEFTTLAQVFADFGTPYYLKIDIEGADSLCIDALKSLEPPKYISIEVEKHSFDLFVSDLSNLVALGYSGFQLVQQETIPFSRPPKPAREGIEVSHRFPFGSSGLFGRDLPVDGWVGADDLSEAYRKVVQQHARFGDFALGKTWAGRQALRVLRLYPGWHDLHCRLPN